jgi:hypothetical protein
MAQWEQIRRQAALVGQVKDAQTGQPLPGVRVTISAAPAEFTSWLAIRARQDGALWAALEERPDRMLTRADGRFHFLDLPNGQYTLTASLPSRDSRYGAAQAQATVSRSGGRIALAAVNLALPPTAIKGQITGRNGAPVMLAEVRIKGGALRTFSDDKGAYLLTAVQAGPQTVVVSAQGYAPKEIAIDSQASLVQTLNIAL